MAGPLHGSPETAPSVTGSEGLGLGFLKYGPALWGVIGLGGCVRLLGVFVESDIRRTRVGGIKYFWGKRRTGIGVSQPVFTKLWTKITHSKFNGTLESPTAERRRVRTWDSAVKTTVS